MSTKKYNSQIGFFTNIIIPSIFAVFLFISSLFFIVIPHFENAMMDRKREMITELTHAASSILEKYHKDENEGLLSREEAQETAISRIKYLRYGEENKDYFWITDMEPKMIVHPYRPELDGQNLENYLDSHGKQMFVEFVNVVKENNHGYVEYMWQWKDDSTHIVPKLSYVQKFEPWNWIVGTGIYIEDVKAEISVLSKTFTRISIIISLIIAGILLWIGRQSFKIEKKKRIAEDELNLSKEKYRSLVEASSEGLIMYMDSKISFVNPIFERMSNLLSEELMERNISEIIYIPEEHKKLIHENDTNFKQITFESKLLKSNLHQNNLIVNIIPIVFYGKDAIIFSVKDISNENTELFYSKRKFQDLMDKLNQGIFRTSLDSKGKFIEANQTALNILGYNEFTEIEDKYIIDFFVDENDKRNFRKNLLDKGFIKNKTIKLIKKNTEQILVSVSLAVIKDNNKALFCDGIIKDVSNLKQTDSNNDNLNQEFITFSQLIYQPSINFAKECLICGINTSLQSLSEIMTSNKSNICLVSSENDEILGLITDEIIRTRGFCKSLPEEIKAYEIMSAPVNFIDEESLVINAINQFKSKETDYLFIKRKDKSIQYLSLKDLLILQEFTPAKLIYNIENAKNIVELKHLRDLFIENILPVIKSGTHSTVIFNNLALLSDLITKRIINLAIKELGDAPVDFAFISLGSEGRQEQSLKTDQDNAIIYADPQEENKQSVAEFFLSFGKYICTSLDKVGYDFCKGEVMAMNPSWNQPISNWKNYFKKWINNGNAKDLLDINIFFDYRLVYGNEHFTNELKKHIIELTPKNPAYLYLLAQNTLKLKPQVNFWGNILLETAGAPPETVNIKEAIMPIVSFARVYSLKEGIIELNTNKRLKELYNRDIITESTYKNITQAFDYLAIIRLQHQASLIQKGTSPDNLINTKLLSDLDKTILKKVLSHINAMLSKLNYDFKGSM